MKIATAACLSGALTSAATIVGLQWPTEQRLGWFELDGRPVALDGRHVEDWEHVNEILTREAAAKVQHPPPQRPHEVPEKDLGRVFEVDYATWTNPPRVQRATVRQSLMQSWFWCGNSHPISRASYSIVAVAPLER